MRDDELLDAFEAGSLPAEAFHHREHVRVAWLHLRAHGTAQAADRFVTGLRRLAAAYGKPQLYHDTITWSFLLLIREREARRPSADFEDFAAANPDLLVSGRTLLARYYRPETLESDLARRVFVMPDRLEPV